LPSEATTLAGKPPAVPSWSVPGVRVGRLGEVRYDQRIVPDEPCFAVGVELDRPGGVAVVFIQLSDPDELNADRLADLLKPIQGIVKDLRCRHG